MTITREPLPGTIPRCCPDHRLHTLDALEWLFAIDAQAAVVEMVAHGWEPAAAARGYRRWIVDTIAGAVDTGTAVALSTVVRPRCSSCGAFTAYGRCSDCGGPAK